MDEIRLPRNILVAVEGSEPSLRDSSMRAARYALKLASQTSARVLAACVVQIPEYIEEGTREMLKDELFAKSKKALEEIGSMASQSGVEYKSTVLETAGAISSAICSLASKEGADLVVLGTRANTSSLTKMMLGSVASGVVANADCPVLVVR